MTKKVSLDNKTVLLSYIPITRSYTEVENGITKYYIEGKASNDLVDWYGSKMSPDLLRKWVEEINGGKKVIIENTHDMEWSADLGVVVKAWSDFVDNITSFYIKAELDPDHPLVPFLIKKLNNQDESNKLGLSIFGMCVGDGWHIEYEVFTNDKGEEVEVGVWVYDDIDLQRIAVTSFPANPDTYIDQVS